jgi:DNA-binding transcriptional LysR family regulator
MPTSLEIRHCRALIAVAEQGGVARAAKSLGVAQSTLSETLLALERALGAAMVLRSRGVGARLTPAAERLIPFARQIVATAEAAAAVLAEGAGPLRVGASESISSYLLPPALRRLREEEPGIDVQVATGLCADLHARVRAGELDLALTLTGESVRPPSDLLVRTLGGAGLSLVARPDARTAGPPLTPAEVARAGGLVPDPRGAFNDLLEAWFAAAGAPARLRSAGSLDAVKRGVLEDGAIGLLPTYAAEREFTECVMVELPLADPLPALAFEAAFLVEGGAAVRLIEAVAAVIGGRTGAKRPTGRSARRGLVTDLQVRQAPGR